MRREEQNWRESDLGVPFQTKAVVHNSYKEESSTVGELIIILLAGCPPLIYISCLHLCNIDCIKK